MASASPGSMQGATPPPTATKPVAVKLAGAASKSYNVASVWEQTAALNESQLQVLDLLGQFCSQRPYPRHVQATDDKQQQQQAAHQQPTLSGGASTGEAVDFQKATYLGTLEEAVLHNTHQFHKWHTELEAACASETEEKYKRYADLLNSHLRSCETILAKVDSTLEYFDTLLAQHRDVSQKSKQLYSSCEQLVREKDQLVEFADAIRAKLKFFDEFETVYAQFQQAQASASLDNDNLLQLLQKLDDCMSYVATNPQYADAGTYVTKFRQLQARALGTVRSKVQQVLKAAVAQVQAAAQESNPSSSAAGTKLAEGTEVSLLYVRFRAAAEPNLKGLFKEIEARAQRPEYLRLLQECQNLYSQARLQLISPFVQQRISEHSKEALPTFCRNGCEHLLRVCQLESQLFEHFFPSSSESPEQLTPLVEPLCTILYDVLRPIIIMLQDMDDLCELIDILKHEVMADQSNRRGAGGDVLRPMLSRTLQDVQARLIFRVQAYIKEEVASFTPSAADLDYPAKVEKAAAEAAAAGSPALPVSTPGGVQEANGDGVDAEANGQAATENGGEALADSNEGTVEQASVVPAAAPGPPAPAVDHYASLYPPLRATLLALSKLYRAVDPKIFGGLAQEAVSACTLSVQQASRQIARKAGPLDAQLFMIKHLLFLREQIAPFDVEFAITDIDLDFTHMRDHMKMIMSGQMSLFTLSSSNAVVKMLGTGGPRVLHYQVDSKKELEKQLKAVCEAFIMAVTKVAVEPLLSFITKVTAVKVAAGSGHAHMHKPLREHAFAAPDKLSEMVARVNEAVDTQLPRAIAKMRLYLANPSTHAILFKPVKSNIAEAHGQIAALLAQEYEAEAVAQVPLRNGAQLNAVLDAMC